MDNSLSVEVDESLDHLSHVERSFKLTESLLFSQLLENISFSKLKEHVDTVLISEVAIKSQNVGVLGKDLNLDLLLELVYHIALNQS